MSNIYWDEPFLEEKNGKGSIEKFTIVSSVEKPRDPVGGYDITGNGGGANSIMFMMVRKPKWFHRMCTKLFLGWVWVDKKDK